MNKPSDLYGRPWSERDYIIALHYYFANRGQPRHHLSSYIKQAATIIGRTPAAVVMRMENYASLDPDEGGNRVGLVNISNIGRRVFAEWSQKKEMLHECASVFIRDIAANNTPTLFDPDPIRIPKAFGKYELLDPLGSGGFGAVFSCVNSKDGLPYALKIIKTDALQDEEIISRFRREIKALKTISHRQIIRIHEDNLEDTSDFPAFIMDLAECSLTAYLEDSLNRIDSSSSRPLLPRQEALSILCSIFDGVEALHTHSTPLIHRDIKPDNILRLVDGSWVLADFSLAKFLPRALVTSTFATASRQAWGTHGYSAPEQFQNFKLADHRADIYGLGVLIWELLSPSWPPFDRTHTLLDPEIERIVLTCTNRDPAQRYDSVAELKSAFQACIV